MKCPQERASVADFKTNNLFSEMTLYDFANSISKSLCHLMTAAELVSNTDSAHHE
jgi:hypothetical protein